MELYQINTTAYREEDMLLLSNASFEQIEEVLQPMVNKERSNDDVWFDHDDYMNALRTALPDFKFFYVPEPTEIVL
jgi:hypothetical protein